MKHCSFLICTHIAHVSCDDAFSRYSIAHVLTVVWIAAHQLKVHIASTSALILHTRAAATCIAILTSTRALHKGQQNSAHPCCQVSNGFGGQVAEPEVSVKGVVKAYAGC